MSTETKHTPGRWEYWRDHRFCASKHGDDCDCEGDFVVGCGLMRRTPESDPWAWGSVCDGVPDERIARLIAEAGTVHHETGLTPRQLVEQRAELLEALEDAVIYLDPKQRETDKRTPETIREWALHCARAAIAKAKGESQ